VWARDMGSEADRRLLERFATRTPWLLDADSQPPQITRFPNADTLTTVSETAGLVAVWVNLPLDFPGRYVGSRPLEEHS
jgi:hypothetical protein